MYNTVIFNLRLDGEYKRLQYTIKHINIFCLQIKTLSINYFKFLFYVYDLRIGISIYFYLFMA